MGGIPSNQGSAVNSKHLVWSLVSLSLSLSLSVFLKKSNNEQKRSTEKCATSCLIELDGVNRRMGKGGGSGRVLNKYTLERGN